MALRPGKSDSDQSKQLKPSGRQAPWRGRPRVDDPKDKKATIRWTAQDYAKLSSRADQAGLSVGAFIRAAALGRTGPRARRRTEADKVTLVKLLAELGKEGSNLNQLTRWANVNRQSASVQTLENTCARINSMLDLIEKALGHGD